MTPLRRLALVAALIACLCASARADFDPPIGRIEVIAELPQEPPYVGEPIVMRVRSSTRAHLALDKIIQPVLTDFDWQQFGLDTSTEAMLDGFWTPVVERVLMVTPLKAGASTIPPFLRRVTIVTAKGERVEADFASAPLVIEVRPHDGVGRADDWWLPAKSVQITDDWQPAPDKIPFGETARRTLTIEAKGLTADRLPPPPVFQAPGVISFLGPVDRQTIVTDDGPIARAVYRWNVRPVSAAPATAPAVHIPWFDISARKMRDAAAPERAVAFLDTEHKTRRPTKTESPGSSSVWPLAAGAASFVWTAAVAYLVATSTSRRSGWRLLLEPTPTALRRLREAARRDDAGAFRRAAHDLSRIDRNRWRRMSVGTDIEGRLAAVDACLFAAASGTTPDLASLASEIATAWKTSAPR